MYLRYALALALTLLSPAAFAACPAPLPGQPVPLEAQPTFVNNAQWSDRQAELEQELAGKDLSKIRLVFLGDSTTEGWDPTIFAQHYGPAALNLGVRGDTTQGMLWRLPRLRLGTALRPELIVLLIGTNDTWPGGNPMSAAIGVGEVVRTLRKSVPGSRILLLGILPRGPDLRDPWRQMAMAMNPLIAACADGTSVFYDEPGRHLVDAAGRLSKDIASDYLHPTPQGYAILASALDPDIRRLLR